MNASSQVPSYAAKIIGERRQPRSAPECTPVNVAPSTARQRSVYRKLKMVIGAAPRGEAS
ncbi:MAG TPA: hypothetical protein VJR48_19020 [Ktedonobacterales bacterium]|nr:hypothetical protein [Ktedonobacterales bacterium]HKT40472.1 hypothetical protein [Ktedonobacterales bacterium]